ncbi:MAG: hypothetical protein WCZ89_03605 [Phycisphaerae bacterium]
MNMFDTFFSPNSRLNDQIARQVFDSLPENGPIMLIAGRDGNFWPSDSQALVDMRIDDSVLQQLWSKIDDGAEPIITQNNECIIAASALATDNTNCGYIALVLPKHQPEAALANSDLIEIVMNQINLIAKLIEKNTKLYELQMRQQPLNPDYIYSPLAAN